MPIIINPDLPPPSPPVTATGPDGILTVQIDAPNAGALLIADFTEEDLESVGNGAFGTNITGWTAYQVSGTSTLSRETASPITSPGSLKSVWTTGSTSAGAYNILDDVIPSGSKVKIVFKVKNLTSLPTRIRCGLADGSPEIFKTFDFPPSLTTQTWVINTTIPEDRQFVRLYLYANSGMDSAGSTIFDDISVTRKLSKIQFVRTNPDGADVLVRSGDPAQAPGGYGIAYDHEAGLGVGVSWYAIPLIGGVEGPPSDAVGLSIPEPQGGPSSPGTWFKSLEDPALSMQIKVHEWRSYSMEGTSQFTRAAGARFSAVAIDELAAPTSSIIVLAYTLEEEEALLSIVNSGVFLTQSKAAYGRRDAYWVVTGFNSERISTLVTNQERYITIPVTQVDRPHTEDIGLRIPGYSYNDLANTYATYSEMADQTYAELVGVV